MRDLDRPVSPTLSSQPLSNRRVWTALPLALALAGGGCAGAGVIDNPVAPLPAAQEPCLTAAAQPAFTNVAFACTVAQPPPDPTLTTGKRVQ